MTVTTLNSEVVYIGNGSSKNFPFAFQIPDQDSIQVLLQAEENAEYVDVTNACAFTGIGNVEGGSVTYPTVGAAINSPQRLTIVRVVPNTQLITVTNQTRYEANVAMRVWDRLTMQIQQIKQALDRTPRFLLGSTATGVYINALEDGQVLTWSEAFQRVVGTTIVDYQAIPMDEGLVKGRAVGDGVGLPVDLTGEELREIVNVGPEFQDFDSLLESPRAARGAGTPWTANQYKYEEAAADAVDHHVTTLGGAKLYEAGNRFSTRARFVQAVARGLFTNLPDGFVIEAGDLRYQRRAGESVITDLPEWIPAGDITPDHWQQNSYSSVVDMAPAITAALAWTAENGLGDVHLSGTAYRCLTPITVPRICGVKISGANLHNRTSDSESISTAGSEIRVSAAMTKLFIWDGEDPGVDIQGLGKTFGLEYCIINGGGFTTWLFDFNNVAFFNLDYCRLIGSANIFRSTFNGTYSGANLPGGHRIYRCNFGASSGVNIELDGNTQDWIEGNWFASTGATVCLKINRSDKINFINNEVNMASGTVFELNDSTGFEATKLIVLAANKINAGTATIFDDNRTNSGSQMLVFGGNVVTGGTTISPRALHNPDSNVFTYAQDADSKVFAAEVDTNRLAVTTTSAVAAILTRDGAGSMTINAENDSQSVFFGMTPTGEFAVKGDADLSTGTTMVVAPATGRVTIAETIRFTPPVSGALGPNGQVTFDSPSNTQFRVLKRGSDGTIRSATLTLA